MSDITAFKDMNPKRYPLHHDHGTVTISRDVFETMSKELERLRPMETGIELAEAERDAYRKRVHDLKKAQRWRNFSEEKPEHHQWIIVFCPHVTEVMLMPKLRITRWDDACKYDVEVQELYSHWMPLPPSPEETKGK